MDMSDVRQYVKLRRRQRELESEAESIKEEADKLQEALLEAFASDSIDNVTADGHVVYLHRQLWAALEPGATKEDVIAGLRASGEEHFVYETYNHQTISAWLREKEDNDEELPESLQGVLTGVEKYSIRVRKAAASKTRR